MNKLLICVGFLCISTNYFAQKEEIIHFQKLHPEVSFISKDHFNLLSNIEIDILKNNYVLFQENIENSDLNEYEQRTGIKIKSLSISNQTEMSDQQFILVKIWLANHPNVKIVKHSEFEALSEADKIVYVNNHCLILIGEIVTLADIDLYPY